MQMEGMIPHKCPPEKLVEHLSDPQLLSLMVPQGCQIGEKAGNTIAFVIRRKVGPINLKMPGEMTVRKKPDSADYVMEVNASHLIGGRASVWLDLIPQKDEAGQQSLRWSGRLEAHGLAARLLESRTAQVGTMLKNLFVRLRKQAEAAR